MGRDVEISDQLFERNDLSSQLMIQLAGLYADTKKTLSLATGCLLPDGFDK